MAGRAALGIPFSAVAVEQGRRERQGNMPSRIGRVMPLGELGPARSPASPLSCVQDRAGH